MGKVESIMGECLSLCSLGMFMCQSWNCIAYRYKFLPNPKDGSIYSIGADGNQLEVFFCGILFNNASMYLQSIETPSNNS